MSKAWLSVSSCSSRAARVLNRRVSSIGSGKGETGITEKHLLFKGRERAIAEKAFVLDANVQLREQILKLSLTRISKPSIREGRLLVE